MQRGGSEAPQRNFIEQNIKVAPLVAVPKQQSRHGITNIRIEQLDTRPKAEEMIGSFQRRNSKQRSSKGKAKEKVEEPIDLMHETESDSFWDMEKLFEENPKKKTK